MRAHRITGIVNLECCWIYSRTWKMLQSKPQSYTREKFSFSVFLSLFYSIVAASWPGQALFDLVLLMGSHCDKNHP